MLGRPAGGVEGAARGGAEARPVRASGGGAVGRSEPGRRGDGGASADRAAPTFHVAGFWQRCAGGFIDLAILAPVCLLLSWLAGIVSGLHLPSSRHRGLDFWLDLLLGSDPALMGRLGLSLAIVLVYAFMFQATGARTLGMRALRMRIIDVYGERPSIGRAAARTAGYLASMATLGLGFLWIGFDSEKRGLHDWLSGTYVVKEDS
jgi:uncharacterized RDD family membrane protein YckC